MHISKMLFTNVYLILWFLRWSDFIQDCVALINGDNHLFTANLLSKFWSKRTFNIFPFLSLSAINFLFKMESIHPLLLLSVINGIYQNYLHSRCLPAEEISFCPVMFLVLCRQGIFPKPTLSYKFYCDTNFLCFGILKVNHLAMTLPFLSSG